MKNAQAERGVLLYRAKMITRKKIEDKGKYHGREKKQNEIEN